MMYSFVHVEIPTSNLSAAATFYGGLFGWKFQKFYGEDYLMIRLADGTEIGGLTKIDHIPYNGKFVNYVAVPDVDAVLAKLERLGGKLVRAKSELPEGKGVFAVVQSPDGFCIGLWAKA